MGRVEYLNDPAAPRPNTLVPACGVLAADDGGRILLQRRRDTGQWALPMGKMELGETPSQCAIRETLEETGVQVQPTGILGIYSDPGHIVAYTDGSTCCISLKSKVREATCNDARADKKNPDRGPMLVIGGEKDHQVPWAISHVTYKEQSENAGVTEIAEIPNRGHSSPSTAAGRKSPRPASTSSSASSSRRAAGGQPVGSVTPAACAGLGECAPPE